ncbi:MAG: hypothetical protein H6835_06245 [Planctomycetes bacterium]|nr:hypothetical protein [Planctomycetota bacterium]
MRHSQQQERLDDPLQQAVALAGLQGQDTATISQAAREAAASDRDHDHEALGDDTHGDGERAMLDELSARDREVRAHEAAHQSAAGELAIGGPSYTFQTGPDGKRYAIGGEVTVRLSEGRTPEETLRKMEHAMQAAHAPDQPSGPDRVVASQAARIAAKARRELAAEKAAQADELRSGHGPRPTGAKVDVFA